MPGTSPNSGDGAHLVGHSYGGLAVLFAAARRPEATLSLTLLEPATFTLGKSHHAARKLVADVRELWDQDLPDEDWVIRFLQLVWITRFLTCGAQQVPLCMWKTNGRAKSTCS